MTSRGLERSWRLVDSGLTSWGYSSAVDSTRQRLGVVGWEEMFLRGFGGFVGRGVCTYKRKESRSVYVRNKSRVTAVIYLELCCEFETWAASAKNKSCSPCTTSRRARRMPTPKIVEFLPLPRNPGIWGEGGGWAHQQKGFFTRRARRGLPTKSAILYFGRAMRCVAHSMKFGVCLKGCRLIEDGSTEQ